MGEEKEMDPRRYAEALRLIENLVCQDHNLIRQLIVLRLANNIRQQDVAESMGCTQSRVAKLEDTAPEKWRLGDIRGYLRAIGYNLSIVIKPRQELRAPARVTTGPRTGHRSELHPPTVEGETRGTIQ